MIRSRSVEEMDPRVLQNFNNENLIVEESRRSRITRDQRQRIMKFAFDKDGAKFYPPEHAAKLLRTMIYQDNFNKEIQHGLFCALNSLLCELYHVKDKSKHLIEAEGHVSSLFELMFFLGQSETDGFLHDETQGGWHHPSTVNEWKPTEE